MTIQRKRYRRNLSAHHAREGKYNGVRKKQSQKITDVDQRGRQTDTEYFAQRRKLT